MTISVEIRVTNTIEVEIPDGLTESEAYNYLDENYLDCFEDAINDGEFDVLILNDLSETEEEN